MSENTKTCPFCGEEIMVTAKKCKHCGEWLEKQEEKVETKECPVCGETVSANATTCKHCGENIGNETTQNSANTIDKIANLDVNDKWKERFRAVYKRSKDGNVWLPQKDNNMSKEEMVQCAKTIYLSDIPSTLSMLVFGGFYYLAKGMWLKLIVYAVIIAVLVMLIGALGYIGSLLWLLAPYDYYRLKVLGKQW